MADNPAKSTGVGTSVVSLAAASALSAWRTRLFWRWQAWRLRKSRVQEHGCGVALYDSVYALDQLGYVDTFCALQHDLVRQTPGLVADTPASFGRRLARELHGTCSMAMLGTPDGTLGGYSWGRLGTVQESLQHYQQVQALGHLHIDDWELLERIAGRQVGNGLVLAVNGIGLVQRYRKGFAPLKQLLKPLLDLGLRNGVTRAMWWAPRRSPVHALSVTFGAQRVFQTDAVTFFMLPDIRPLARIFAALPASGIADLLARVSPHRVAPPPPTPARPHLSVVSDKSLPRRATV